MIAKNSDNRKKKDSEKYAEWLRSETVTSWLKALLQDSYLRSEQLILSQQVRKSRTAYSGSFFSKEVPSGTIHYWLLFDPKTRVLVIFEKYDFINKKSTDYECIAQLEYFDC